MFQELYYYADIFCPGGRLPVSITFLLDEFANVALPKDFLKLLATMRSRNIAAVPVIQNIAQIKGMYKDRWEEIPGNCDVLLYLGGNETATHEYISKKLGKKTIYKRSNSVSRGAHGSTSQSVDALGRELKMADEVGMLPNHQCMVFVRGQRPICDDKFPTFQYDRFLAAQALGKYTHTPENHLLDETTFKVLNLEEIKSYEELKQKYPNRIQITTLSPEQIIYISKLAQQRPAASDDHPNKEENGKWKQYSDLMTLLQNEELSEEDLSHMNQAVEAGLTDEQLLLVLQNPDKADSVIKSLQFLNQLPEVE